MSIFFQYGKKVDGYDVLVLNEREARAGAGILFEIGLLSLMNFDSKDNYFSDNFSF